MPREHKKRGRHAAHKRRRDDPDENEASSWKRRRTSEAAEDPDGPPADFIALHDDAAEADHEASDGRERRFYGLLDEQEHEYFKNADQMLEVNQFRDADERSIFIENLHKEAGGKELKLACEQTGSRLMERLILLSTHDQLKSLFQKFDGEYIHLMSHRFASHCCETLFKTSAPVVSEELANAPVDHDANEMDGVGPSMESLFLNVLHELDENLAHMITDKFASHTLRVLLFILSGKAVDDPDAKSIDKTQHKSLVAGKRKAKIAIDSPVQPSSHSQASLAVPQSFSDNLLHVIQTLVAGLDTTTLRALATQRTANPTLQLILQLELTVLGKQRGVEADSMLKKLLPDDPITPESDSARFLNGIMSDPVGSHLVQTVIQYAPGKVFKNLYKEVFKSHMAHLACHDTASYVICQILERLSVEDLQQAADSLIAEVPRLLEWSRTNILRTLAERMTARKINSKPLADAITSACSTDNSRHLSLPKMLQLPDNLPEVPASTKPEAPLHIVTSSSQNAASVLTQALLQIPGPLSGMVFDALNTLGPKHLRCLAHTSPLSPILQTALTADTASIIFRRKLITQFYGAIAEYSLSPSASHVIDAVERGSRRDLAFVRERIAEELSENEAALRENTFGRKVWRNWDMDLYQRDRDRWIKETRRKVGNNGFQSFPGLVGEADAAAKEKGKGGIRRVGATAQESIQAAAEIGGNTYNLVHEQFCEPLKVSGKTALDRARERYAQKHPPQHQQPQTNGTTRT
ncbi:MAG: hypothetical protein Q9159_002560 [Coniocarpon cinnabarinum]